MKLILGDEMSIGEIGGLTIFIILWLFLAFFGLMYYTHKNGDDFNG